MIIYGVEKHLGEWDDSLLITDIAFASRKMAEKYKAEAEAESLALEKRINECNLCHFYYYHTSDDGTLTIPIEKARATCPRASIDEDGHLACHESGIWGVPHYHINEIEFIQEGKE